MSQGVFTYQRQPDCEYVIIETSIGDLFAQILAIENALETLSQMVMMEVLTRDINPDLTIDDEEGDYAEYIHPTDDAVGQILIESPLMETEDGRETVLDWLLNRIFEDLPNLTIPVNFVLLVNEDLP